MIKSKSNERIMRNLKLRIQQKINRLRCHIIRSTQKPVWPDMSKGYLSIFYDYEGDYALPSMERAEASLYGVRRILEICKKNGIKATFNTVGKLFNDHPDIIRQIIADGHDLASHSFKHDDISRLSRKEIDTDIKLTKEVFKAFGLELRGMRSPQNRWSFKQMEVMLKNGLRWSAEGDKTRYPYVLLRRAGKSLLRMPVSYDDYFYISESFTPDAMYKRLTDVANNLRASKSFGSIGFHPWVNGQAETRLQTMDKFFKFISEIPELKVITFDEAFKMTIMQQNI